METLLLTEAHVAGLVRAFGSNRFMELTIDRLRTQFALAGESDARSLARDGLQRGPGGTGVIEWMPHHQPGRAVTIKIVSYTPSNPDSHGLPTIGATPARFDDLTGRLLALADGGLLTAIRTGAASAVASGLLADPASRVLGIVGAGAQAVTQAHALSRIFPLERILVHDTDESRTATFPDRVKFLDTDIRPAATPAELESSADIICTVTSVGVGDGPVLLGVNLRPHVHINAVGADLPGKVEIPLPVLKSALVTADHPEQARREGESRQLGEADLGPDDALCHARSGGPAPEPHHGLRLDRIRAGRPCRAGPDPRTGGARGRRGPDPSGAPPRGRAQPLRLPGQLTVC